jgi:hypothetical protein
VFGFLADLFLPVFSVFIFSLPSTLVFYCTEILGTTASVGGSQLIKDPADRGVKWPRSLPTTGLYNALRAAQWGSPAGTEHAPRPIISTIKNSMSFLL